MITGIDQLLVKQTIHATKTDAVQIQPTGQLQSQTDTNNMDIRESRDYAQCKIILD